MSQPQYMDALDRANKIRLARSDAKHRIYAGELAIADAFDLECCQRMTAMQLLCSQYRWQRRRALGVLVPLRIGESRRVMDLTVRQRELLVQACSPREKAA